MPRSLHPVVGDSKLTFVGHSYGSLVGATYAGLFPGRARALLLVDPIDADTWVNRPFEAIREQAAGLEHGLGRFFAACAVHQNACGFGATDPQDAFDDLAAALDAAPAPAPRAADPRPVDGDDLRFASMYAMISPGFWPGLATALREAQGGDGSVNLEPNLGTPGGDGLPDRVIAAGTDGDDAVTVSGGANGAVAVTGLAARLGITHAESIDSLAIDTRAGHDTVDASGLAPNTIQLTTD